MLGLYCAAWIGRHGLRRGMGEGKHGCGLVAAGVRHFTNLSVEQVKPLLWRLATLLELSLFIFQNAQLCLAAQHEAGLRNLKTSALRLKIRKKTAEIPNLFSTPDRSAA